MVIAKENLDIRIAGKYQLQRRIGGGGFGNIYIGTNVDNDEEVAIKLGYIYKDQPFLEAKVDIYRSLAGSIGIPYVYEFLF
ncbi:hypothetical protein ABVK25_007142 [Lepraria finkii]|uniref:Protein kinase domain-containing protein n=1 Tax=Lepraria finkii TaxID=1340010 RepID=A0ABR4B3W2_9LECA